MYARTCCNDNVIRALLLSDKQKVKTKLKHHFVEIVSKKAQPETVWVFHFLFDLISFSHLLVWIKRKLSLTRLKIQFSQKRVYSTVSCRLLAIMYFHKVITELSQQKRNETATRK